MTTTSPRTHKRRVALPSMESLGFDESAFDSSTRVYTSAPTATTTTIETVVGKHSKKGVEGLWETTVIDAPTLENWTPSELGRILQRRRIRWTPVVLTVLLVLGLSYFGYWLYQQPTKEAAAAQLGVSSHAAALASELDNAREISRQLAIGNLSSDYITALSTVDDTARELFSSAAALDSDRASSKAFATEAASQALADTQRIRDAAGFRMTLEPALTRPDFVTDPDLITIPDAALAFGGWRAELDGLAERLPSEVSPDLTAAFTTFRASLASAQRDYIDALAANDGFEAIRVMTAIDADIADLHDLIATVYEALTLEVETSISDTRQQLEQLVG